MSDHREKTALTALIRDLAKALGFDLVGVAPANPLEGAEFFARWLALGYAGDMAYLDRRMDVRCDPALYVPDAKSVICVGLHYRHSDPDADSPAPASPRGRIAT